MHLKPMSSRESVCVCVLMLVGCTGTERQSAHPRGSVIRALETADIRQDVSPLTSNAAGQSTARVERPDSAAQAKSSVGAAERAFSIDMPTALRLAAAQNHIIAVAKERIEEARVEYDAAYMLLLPTLNPGLAYHYQRGRLQETNGNLLEVDRASGFAGLGGGAVGAGAVVPPGVSIVADLSSVLFEPLAARQKLNVAEHGAKSVRNQILLDVAIAYYDLVHAKAQRAISQETAQHAADLAELTARFAETGIGLESDAQRVAVEKVLREKDLRESEEAVLVRSAILAGLLHLDVTVVLDPAETNVVPVTMVEDDDSLGALVATALAHNPVIVQREARVAYEHERYRQAQYRPWLPSFALNASVGAFRGEGGGHTLADGGSRVDYNAQIIWTLSFDHITNARRQRSRHRQARLEQEGIKKDVEVVVVQAHHRVESTKDQIALTVPAIESAQRSLQLNRNRIFDKQGLPIEVLQAIDSLAAARRVYLDPVIAHNKAQFRLYTAMGQPPMAESAPD